MIRKDYTFDASERKVYFTNEISIEQLGIIYNITDGILIYNPSSPAIIGTLYGNILTLIYDTSSMSNTDDLQIFYSQIDDIATTNNPTQISGNLNLPLVQREDGVLRVDDQSLDRIFGSQNLANLDGRLKVETKNQDQYFICKLQTLNQEYGVDITGQAGATIQLSGTFTGTITFEATADGGTYVAINGQAINGVAAVSTTTTVGIFRFNVTGLQRIRCRCSAAMTGVALITFRLSSASYDNLIASMVITAGSASIGAVTEATLDPTVLPIAMTWPVAPTAPAVQTTFPHPNSFRYPQIKPNVRTQMIGDQQLPYKQQPNTLEQLVKDIDGYRMLEKIWLNLAMHNQMIASAYNIPLPRGWETIQ